VPYSLLGAALEEQTTEQVRPTTLYPLPRAAANGIWPSPVEVVVEGDRIRVRKGPAKVEPGGGDRPRRDRAAG
jgi:hypothetical protein